MREPGGDLDLAQEALTPERRSEVWIQDFEGDEAVVLSRIRAGVAMERAPLRIHAAVQDVRRYGEVGPGSGDGSFTGLQEGYLQVGLEETWLRLGRQAIAFGDQRLIGALDWSMAGRSFDALRLHTERDAVAFDVFGAVVRMRRDVSDAAGSVIDSSGDQLAGVHAAIATSEASGFDVYFFYRHDGPDETDVMRERHVLAPGLRVHGEPHPHVRYVAETAFQSGRVRDQTEERIHRAAALAGELTGVLVAPTWLDLSLGGSLATGDEPDGSWTEFDNFYPTNHKFYGAIDLIGLRNVREGYLRLTGRLPDRGLVGSLTPRLLGLAEPTARWSDAGGRTLGQSTAPGSAALGTELDATLRWTPLAELFLEGGYAIFVPSAGAKRLGHAHTTHFLYVWLAAQLP